VQLLFTPQAWDDYLYWQTHDLNMIARINALLADTRRTPFSGIGKPEPLRGSLSGWWSRRVTAEHRLVYRCTGKDKEQRIEIVQCRYHY
jgi:toxin YoeB